MKVMMWIDLFDDGYPGYHAKFLDDNPHRQWAARTYKPHCKGKNRLFLFSEWLPGTPPALDSHLLFWSTMTLRNGFDGIDMHEAWNFESNPAHMRLLGEMAKRLGIEKGEK